MFGVRLQALRNSAFNLWRQEETSSLRLLSVHNSGWRIIIYFSNKYRIQCLFVVLYCLALASIFQEIVCECFCPLKSRYVSLVQLHFYCLREGMMKRGF